MTQKELRKKYMQIIKTEAYPHDAKMRLEGRTEIAKISRESLMAISIY